MDLLNAKALGPDDGRPELASYLTGCSPDQWALRVETGGGNTNQPLRIQFQITDLSDRGGISPASILGNVTTSGPLTIVNSTVAQQTVAGFQNPINVHTYTLSMPVNTQNDQCGYLLLPFTPLVFGDLHFRSELRTCRGVNCNPALGAIAWSWIPPNAGSTPPLAGTFIQAQFFSDQTITASMINLQNPIVIGGNVVYNDVNWFAPSPNEVVMLMAQIPRLHLGIIIRLMLLTQ